MSKKKMELISKIDKNNFYTVNDLIDFDIMKAPKVESKKRIALRFINSGRIKAKNIQTEKKPRYVIMGKDLINFVKKYYE
jgi:hypothetical protein